MLTRLTVFFSRYANIKSSLCIPDANMSIVPQLFKIAYILSPLSMPSWALLLKYFQQYWQKGKFVISIPRHLSFLPKQTSESWMNIKSLCYVFLLLFELLSSWINFRSQKSNCLHLLAGEMANGHKENLVKQMILA